MPRHYPKPELIHIKDGIKRAYNKLSKPTDLIDYHALHEELYPDPDADNYRTFGAVVKRVILFENAAFGILFDSDVKQAAKTKNPKAAHERMALHRGIMMDDNTFLLGVVNPKYSRDPRQYSVTLPNKMITIVEGGKHGDGHKTGTGFVGPDKGSVGSIMKNPPISVQVAQAHELRKKAPVTSTRKVLKYPDAQKNWATNRKSLVDNMPLKQIVNEANRYRLYHMGELPLSYSSVARRFGEGKGYVGTSTGWVMDFVEFLRIMSLKCKTKK